MVKLCISATSEKRMIFKGRGSSSVIAESPSILHAWETVIVSTEKIAKVHADIGKKVNEQCAEPVASFIKDMEKAREKTVQDGQKATKEYEDALAAVDKAKQAYHRASLDSEIAEKELVDSKADAMKSKDSKVAFFLSLIVFQPFLFLDECLQLFTRSRPRPPLPQRS